MAETKSWMPTSDPLKSPQQSLAQVCTRPPHSQPTGMRASATYKALALAALAALSWSPTATAEPKAAPAAEASAQRPTIPKPHRPSKEELEFMAAMDRAMAPLANHDLSKEDGARIKDAIKAISANKREEADALAAAISDKAGKSLIAWYRLRAGMGTLAEFNAFFAANPLWSKSSLLAQKAEEALFAQGGSAAEIKAFFKDREPETGAGVAALASASLAEGNTDEAKRLAVKAWREYNISAALEPGFLSRFGTMLTAADHKWRLDRLLIASIRWSDDKKARAAIVRRVIPLLSAPEQKKANIRLAVFLGQSGAKTQIEALAAEREPDFGLLFSRIFALRRANKIEEATKLMLGAPTEEALIVSPDEWWGEREELAYDALALNKPKLAYELVREAGPLSVNPLKEQTFMAGWIALRYLKDPAKAETHFTSFLKAADGPLSRAKAAYWLGRTAEAKNDRSTAEEFYRRAVTDPDTFHGLLARQKLEPARRSLTLSAPKQPTADEIERFLGLPDAKAVIVASKAGLDPSIMRAFIVQLRNAMKTEGELALLAHLAEAARDTQSAVRVGKAAITRGLNLYYYAYPVHPFPAYQALRKPPETAMLLGLARQETEFNTLIVSGAGAKGLLQVMTITAKHVCRDYKVKCDTARLLSDPSYNTMLASAYVGDRMDEFQGSYILTLAGYNAGPGRARQWIREFGDPRDAKIDPIDWIERIPIQETREYVGKVLANIQVYRARLGEEETALRLDEDLARARQQAGAKPEKGSRAAASAANPDG